MRIAIAFSAALIGTTAVADDAVHPKCAGTQFVSGFNNNVPWPVTISVVVGPDWVTGDVGGKIIHSDDQSIAFMVDRQEVTRKSANDNWTTFDVCSYGSIDRVKGKARVQRTNGKCNQRLGPAVTLDSLYDLVCTVVKQRLF
jgi:hypothetical protein